MTKLQALEKKYEKAKREEAAYHERIAAKERELATLMRSEAAAATAGNMETYTATKEKRKGLEDEIFVLKSSDPAALIKTEEVMAAWDDCVKEYRKAVIDLENAIVKEAKELLAIYRKMEVVQTTMLKQRETCAEIGRIEPNLYDYEDKYRGKLPVEFVEMKTKQKVRLRRTKAIVAEYLAEAGILTDDDVAWANMIFGAHRLF